MAHIKGLPCVAPAVLELTLQARLALNSRDRPASASHPVAHILCFALIITLQGRNCSCRSSFEKLQIISHLCILFLTISAGLIRTLDSITKGNSTFLLKELLLYPLLFWKSGCYFSHNKVSLSRAYREIITRRGWGWISGVECLPHVPQGWVPALNKTGSGSIWLTSVLRRWRQKDHHPWLSGLFTASLGYIKLCL